MRELGRVQSKTEPYLIVCLGVMVVLAAAGLLLDVPALKSAALVAGLFVSMYGRRWRENISSLEMSIATAITVLALLGALLQTLYVHRGFDDLPINYTVMGLMELVIMAVLRGVQKIKAPRAIISTERPDSLR